MRAVSWQQQQKLEGNRIPSQRTASRFRENEILHIIMFNYKPKSRSFWQKTLERVRLREHLIDIYDLLFKIIEAACFLLLLKYYHKFSGLKHKNVLSNSFGGQKSKIGFTGLNSKYWPMFLLEALQDNLFACPSVLLGVACIP